MACVVAVTVGLFAASFARSADFPAHADAVARVSVASGAVDVVVDVGRDPLALAIAGGSIWVHNVEDGTLSRVDPATNGATVVRLGDVVGIAAAGEDLWAAYRGNRLARLDGRTGRIERTLRIGTTRLFKKRDAGFPTFTRDAVWLTVPVLGHGEARQRLVRVDPSSGRTTDSIPIPADPGPPAAAGRFLWIIGRYRNVLARIDTTTRRVSTVPTGFMPSGVAVGAKSIWVTHDFGRSVWRFDPASLRVRARIAMGERARGVAFGKGRVWVATETGLRAIDPRTNRVVSRLQLSAPAGNDGPIGVGLLDDGVWVSIE